MCTLYHSLLTSEAIISTTITQLNMRLKYHLHHEKGQEHHLHLAQQHEHQSRFHEVSSSSVLLLGAQRAQVKAKQRFTMESESSFFCRMV